MKTPDEIKKGLECCNEMCDSSCPYWEDSECPISVRNDALAYIKQLEADNAQQARCIENLTDKLNATNDALPCWISVEERLPEGNDDVIVYVQSLINGHCWVQTAHHLSTIGMDECEDDEYWLDGAGEIVRCVTHWMPLPEPPDEGANKDVKD